MEKVTVIKDSREKEDNGYTWEENNWCDGYLTRKLDTGDYSLLGYEDKVCIERKRSTGELCTNILESRFERELERMTKIPHAFIICEFTLEDILNFPINSGIPSNKWSKLKVTPQFFMKKIGEYQIRFNTQFLFCGQHGFDMVNSIFKRVIDAYPK